MAGGNRARWHRVDPSGDKGAEKGKNKTAVVAQNRSGNQVVKCSPGKVRRGQNTLQASAFGQGAELHLTEESPGSTGRAPAKYCGRSQGLEHFSSIHGQAFLVWSKEPEQ